MSRPDWDDQLDDAESDEGLEEREAEARETSLGEFTVWGVRPLSLDEVKALDSSRGYGS